MMNKLHWGMPAVVVGAILGGIVLTGCKNDQPQYNENNVEMNKAFAKKQAELANEAQLKKNPLPSIHVVQDGQTHTVKLSPNK